MRRNWFENHSRNKSEKMGEEEIRGNSLSTNYQNDHGGGEGTRTPDLLAASETLSQLSYTPTKKLHNYIQYLTTRALSDSYITENKKYLTGFVNTIDQISPETAYLYLSRSNHLSVNSRIRYAGYLKGFLNFLGIDFNISMKRPKLLPNIITEEHIEALKQTIKEHRTHKYSVYRDLALINTAIKTGLRRAELANLKVSHIDFHTPKITVVSGKGNKDRVVPIGESLKEELYELTQNKEPNESVFGLNHRSLGMKIKEWSSKANVPIHTHSFRHYFATKLIEKGANIRVVQELLGHSNLNTTQVYLSVTGEHLESAIQLLN